MTTIGPYTWAWSVTDRLSLLVLLENKVWFVPKPFRHHGVVLLQLCDGGLDEVWMLSTTSLAFFSFKSPD